MKILITGGAGFVGTQLAVLWKQKFPNDEIICLDNLKRRGSEFNLPKLKYFGIKFTHGDVRSLSDLNDLGSRFDICVEASAEPSVHSGGNGSPDYVIQTNLTGALNCFEFARKNCGFLVFLSTSRVYSIDALRNVSLEEGKTRLKVSSKALDNSQTNREIHNEGITELFPTNTSRSFYGSTKLAAELFLQEYFESYGVKGVINRCGVLCGEGQWGKTDQGVYTLWVARHAFNGSLKYTGFGGRGFQVRDVLHPEDLFELIVKQVNNPKAALETYNVGGGIENSTSLCEYTDLCQRITGNRIDIGSDLHTAKVDIPYYVTCNEKVTRDFDWRPRITVSDIVSRINNWLNENNKTLRPFFME